MSETPGNDFLSKVANAAPAAADAQDTAHLAGVPVIVEDGLDFSNEPVFELDEKEGEWCEVPGLPIRFKVRKFIDFGVDSGRSRYAKQTQAFVPDGRGKRKPGNEVQVSYDIAGLFLYKCEHCIIDFDITDPKSGVTKRWNGNPGHTRACFQSIKSRRVCSFINDEIDRVVGWDKEGEETKEAFPGDAA